MNSDITITSCYDKLWACKSNLIPVKTGKGLRTDTALVLKDIIGETKFAASDKETRPILTGINFKAHDHVLEVVFN